PISLSPASIEALVKVPQTEYAQLNSIIKLMLMDVLKDKVTESTIQDARDKLVNSPASQNLAPPLRAAVTEMAQHALRTNFAPDYQATVQ
ncbi:hypothetical protein ABTM82_19255, partial [Acinetobacter baumannii]